MKQQNGRKTSYIKLFLIIAILAALLLNTVIWLIPRRVTALDVTDNRLYTVSEESRVFLAGLEREVTLYVFDADGSDARFEEYLKTLDACGKNFKVRFVRSEDEPALLSEAGLTASSVIVYTMVVKSDARSAYADYTDLFYYETGNSAIVQFANYYRAMYGMATSEGPTVQMSMTEYATYYQLFGQSESYAAYLEDLIYDSELYFQGEQLIPMIEYAASDVIPRKYVLTGHGETPLAGTMLGSLLSYFGMEAYTSLDLTQVGEIPADASAVLMLNPTVDYSAEKLDLLRQYLTKGGTLSVVTGEKAPSELPGLMSLLAEYGMTVEEGTVRDTVTVVTEETDKETGEKNETSKTEITDSVEVVVNTSHDAMVAAGGETSLTPVITKGNSIRLDSSVKETLSLSPLMVSGKSSFLSGKESEKGAKALAAAAETEDGAKLLWFTGAESYTAKVEERTDSDVYNNFCLMIGMDWTDLVYRSEVKTASAIPYAMSYLNAKQSHVTVIGVVSVIVLPIALVVAGLILRYKRKRA